MGALKVFLIFLVVRVLSVFVVTTFFVPDEYWQSLEVAHKLAFGYGYQTWEWTAAIRSYLYPIVFAAYYKLLGLLGHDTIKLLVLGPRVIQALLTAYSDYRFYVWSGRKKWAVFLLSTSAFWFYTGSRTLINTLETSLTTIALSIFPWHSGGDENIIPKKTFSRMDKFGDFRRTNSKFRNRSTEGTGFLWLMTLCCYIRPTAALTWLPLCMIHLKNSRHSSIELIIKRYIPIGLTTCAACVAADSYIYGKLTIPPANFFMYNVYENIGSFYGVHDWYWFITAGLPMVLGIMMLPFAYAVWDTMLNLSKFPIRKALLLSIGFTLVGLSLIEHKEQRFLLIILPMCLYICTDFFSQWSIRAHRLLIWILAAVILAGNLAPAWYFSTVHQKGALEIMKPLAEIASTYKDADNNPARILFFMPCHSTPYYSHIHKNITMYFVECDPKNQYDYQIYENDPERWLRMQIPAMPLSKVPSHVVLFSTVESKIGTFLSPYRKINNIHHTDYPVTNTGPDILIYELKLKEEYENQFVELNPPSYSTHDEF